MKRLTLYVRIVVVIALLLLSWRLLFLLALNARTASIIGSVAKECTSAFIGIAAFAVLFLPVSPRGMEAPSVMQRVCLRLCFVVALTVILIVHFIVHLTIPPNHRQTEELMLIFCRLIFDVVMFFLGCGMILCPVHRICQRGSMRHLKDPYFVLRSLSPWRIRGIMTGGALLIIFMLWALPLLPSDNTKSLLEVGMLGDRVDFCGLEGLQLSRAAATGWVLPQYTHRRLFNAFTGSDKCGTNKISFLDEDEGVLIVSPMCQNGYERPIVYIERPEQSELHGRDVLPKVRGMNKAWHKTLEKRYGTNETIHKSMGVRVTRGPRGVIRSVQILPSHLIPVLRKPRTRQEELARANWPSKHAWVVPLGVSVAYTVSCPSSGYDEYHMFPPIRYPGMVTGDNTKERKKQDTASPPANVLLLILDAVSRQEVVRSLPKFSNWLRNFRDNQSSAHMFVEAQGATTVGHSTKANLNPLFSGNYAGSRNQSEILKTSLFRLAKEKYGDRFSSSYTNGECLDVLVYIFDETKERAGFGDSCGNDLDYNTFGPFCHMQYPAFEDNYQGANSILKRCIGQQYVHEYILNYTRALLKRQLRQRRQEEKEQVSQGNSTPKDSFPVFDKATFFFDVAHFLEGHEGTHGVLYLVDDALTNFLEELRTDLRFFDDPSNVLVVMSDHGNHMGHYFELTTTGKLERSLPFVGMIFHPEVLSRIDTMKGYSAGSSLAHLRQRTRRISTPFDMYLTFADLLGVKGKNLKENVIARIPPSSLFDSRSPAPKAEKCSEIGAQDNYGSGCYLMWCEKK